MSQARASMTSRCVIERNARRGTGTDPYGNDPEPLWEALSVGTPCRYWFDGVRTVMDGDKATEVTTRKMTVPSGTDVTEDDRIRSVTDRLGNTLADGPMRIDGVGHRRGHIVLTMVDVR